MKNRNKEILKLIDKYGSDTRRALKENKKLPYLYALSELRENVLEWFDFKNGARLLQVGADYGALTGLFARRVSEVTVLDESEESLSVVKARYSEASNITYACGSLTGYAKTAKETDEGMAAKGTCEGAEVTGEDGQRKATAPGFDYITLIGTLCAGESTAEQLEPAKELLLPGGVLLLAACNRFGLKYLAGAMPDEVTVTKKELTRLLPGGRFYYPVPDYRITNELFSDGYLPRKGDLAHVLAVYDYPRYPGIDVGAAYDAACEDGQFDNFTNSFLVIWEKGA